MNESIINYFRENKDKFSREILVGELRKIGHSEADILESVQLVYGANSSVVMPIPPSIQNNFWDFKSKKVYTKTLDKLKDFLFGFFGPYIALIMFGMVPFLGIFLWFGAYVYVIVYVFNRRRFISYGMIASFMISAIVTVIFVITTFTGGIF